MFQIIVDSAANIPAELVKKYKIKVLSFINFVNGKEVTCFDPELSPEEERKKGHEYYDAVRQGADVKTGLISTAIFEDAFRSAMENNEDVLYFSLSKNISGNFNSARLAAEDLMHDPVNGRKIRLIDSLNASLAQGILAIYASEMRDKGMEIDEVADILETYPAKMNGVFTVGDLKYLSRTGRLSGATALVGNLLSIKPILRGNKDGFIVQYKKCRGRISQNRKNRSSELHMPMPTKTRSMSWIKFREKSLCGNLSILLTISVPEAMWVRIPSPCSLWQKTEN